MLDMKLNKMLQDISLLRRLWVLILFITVSCVPMYGLDRLTHVATP